MPRSIPIPFGIMAYQDRSIAWNAQRLVNWYAETAPKIAHSKSPVVLLPRPGLELFAEVLGPWRGDHAIRDTDTNALYAVFGTTLYNIASDGSANALGTISGTNLVTMADNGDQLTIVAEPKGWVYTVSTDTFQQITDPNFPGSAYVCELAGYFVHVIPDNTGQFIISALNDGLVFDALDVASAEMDSDSLIAVWSDHGELWLFGVDTIEPWGTSGNADFPFSPVLTARIQRGCAAAFSIARQDNSLFWIGDDMVVYRANGYTPLRVSTHAIEKLLQDSSDVIQSAIGGSYTQNGHSFYSITLPGQWTLYFDNSTGMWHERSTFGLNHWKAVGTISVYGKILAGQLDGNLYSLELNKYTDDGLMIQRVATSPPIHANTSRMTMSRLQVDVQPGMGLTSGQGSDPMGELDWSDDGGQTWSNSHWRGLGKIGEYGRRVIWRRLGQFYQRVFRLTITDPIFPPIIGAYADVEVTPP